jgi:hypothetical protein
VRAQCVYVCCLWHFLVCIYCIFLFVFIVFSCLYLLYFLVCIYCIFLFSAGHWSIIQVLSRKGIYVTEAGEANVTETVLMQTAPFKVVSSLPYSVSPPSSL